MYKLYHNDILIGTVSQASANGFKMHGSVEFTDAATAYLDVFAFFAKDEAELEEPPFSDEILENWFMEDSDGVRREIGLPGIAPVNGENDIWWRYF
jgi:hypothetical protein